MESLNLNTLANSLPTSNLAGAEKELLNNFRAAALSITTLYRSSRTTSKRAYNSGYAAACHDLLQMIQQGVSDSETEGGSGMPTIGRVMDWVEGRLEAIRAREEEEEEDEERDRDREKTKDQLSKVKASLARASSAPVVPTSSPIVPSKPPQTVARQSTPPSPPAPQRPLPAPVARAPKPRASAASLKDAALAASTSAPALTTIDPAFSFGSAVPVVEEPISIAAGAKRRHAVMMMLDSSAAAEGGAAAAATPGAGSSRRRTRSARGASLQAQAHHQSADAMDVEEDTRERKRIARR